MGETLDAGSIKNNNGDWIPSFTPSYFIGPVNQQQAAETELVGLGVVSQLASATSDNTPTTLDTSSNGN